MRATFIIRHKEISLDGDAATKLVDTLAAKCGTLIEDHEAALKMTLAFRDSFSLVLPLVTYAFGPTLHAVAICSRATTDQLDVHIETTRSDICSICNAVASRMAKVLKRSKPHFEIVLVENDGKETGITAKNVTFLSSLAEQLREYKVLPGLITILAGFATIYALGKNLETGIIVAAVSFAMLLVFIVLSCMFETFGSNRLDWKFQDKISL